MDNTLEQTIEQLIDKHSLAVFTTALAAVCDAKAEHVLETWQDEGLSAAWQLTAAHFYRTPIRN